MKMFRTLLVCGYNILERLANVSSKVPNERCENVNVNLQFMSSCL